MKVQPTMPTHALPMSVRNTVYTFKYDLTLAGLVRNLIFILYHIIPENPNGSDETPTHVGFYI